MARTITQLISGLRQLSSGVAQEAADLLEKVDKNSEPNLYRHVKRESEYRVAPMTFELQSSKGPISEGAKLIIYVSSDSSLKGWAREESEFNDGRFEKVQNDHPA